MTRSPLTAEDRGLIAALKIQRYETPRDWRACVDRILDADERQVAEQYLRGMLERMKTAKRSRRFRPSP
jgi:hypothetical protein